MTPSRRRNNQRDSRYVGRSRGRVAQGSVILIVALPRWAALAYRGTFERRANRTAPSGVRRSVPGLSAPGGRVSHVTSFQVGGQVMFPTSRLAARVAWLPAALLIVAGCNQGPSPEVQARIDSLSQASTQRDRLMQEVAEHTRLVSEISRELARVNVPARALKVSGESPLRASRDTLIQKIRYMTTRVKEIEPRLKESEQRIKDLTTLSDSLRNELASTMQNLQGVIANQKETIDALTLQVETLTAENSALRDTLENMSTISNTVYYVVGTKDELEQKGIITEEGGARFLFVLWKSGKTLVPSRNLDPGVFTVADRRHFTELPLPASDKEYRIVSRQDTSALETPPDHDGKISGRGVKIADPAKFWANSKYLIIVEG